MMKNMKFVLAVAILAAGLPAMAETAGPSQPDLMGDVGLPHAGSLSNLVGSAGANVGRVGTDAINVFSTFSKTNPLAIGVVALKVPDGYGFGIEAHSQNPSTVAQVGFGIFGWQERDKASGKMDWAFADATINLSVSTHETVPVLGWPFELVVESGPAFKFAGQGHGFLMEQSAALTEFTFDLPKGYITLGGGILHCSDPLFANKAIPMADANYTFRF